MKQKLIRLMFTTLTFLILSCEKDRINGIFYYMESDKKDKSIYTMGRDIACSIIGQFEFKDGKCYVNVMGVQKRLDYEIDNNVIYLKNMDNSGETGLTIIDDNTISYMGCLFKKDIQNSQEKNNKSEAETNILKNENSENKSSSFNNNKTFEISRESRSGEAALVKDIFEKDNKKYLSLDIVQIKFTGNVNDYDIINENPKIRVFEVSDKLEILDKDCKHFYNSDYLIRNRDKIISKEDYDICGFSSKNGVITSINLGCWN